MAKINVGSVETLLAAVTVTGAGSSYNLGRGAATFQAKGQTSSGTGAATVNVEVSLDEVNWLVLGTITLTLGTTTTSDGFVSSSDVPWAFIRGNVTSISGTGAAVSLLMGR